MKAKPTNEIRAFLLEKILSGKFKQIASIPTGKKMEYIFIPYRMVVKSHGTHFEIEHYSHTSQLMGSMTITVKNLISSFAPLMGRAAGSATSKAKAAASRQNGKLGGRPKKEKKNEAR